MTQHPSGNGTDPRRSLRHELRTPINHMIGYGELLVEEAEDVGREDIVADVHRILSAARQLLSLIDELLDPATDRESSLEEIQHELRTPLNQIIGYSELLKESTSDAGLASLVPDLQHINAAAKHFLDLQIEHLESGKYRAHPESSGGATDPPRSLRSSRGGRLERGSLLVVDDDAMNRDVLARHLQRQGHQVALADGGIQALALTRDHPIDLILLDVLMPDLDGYSVLQRLRADPVLRHVPVIMLSGLDDMASTVRCIELGADDFLHKPFEPVLLQARIQSSLERKRLRDQEQAYLSAIRQEQERSEQLLLNILPEPIAERLKNHEQIIADGYGDATVLFADIVGFTRLSAHVPPDALVSSLNAVFSYLDELGARHGLEKIKTIGDAYMAVAGVPHPRPDHAVTVAEMALELQMNIKQFHAPSGHPFAVRIGIDSGPVVAGVIGRRKFAYDLWGDTVNTASRMESLAPVGGIQVTSSAYALLRDYFRFQPRPPRRVKGKGQMATYILTGRLQDA